MTNEEINEALDAIRPLVCDEFKSVEKDWANAAYLDLKYIYQKWNGSEPWENKEKAKVLINFLTGKLDEGKLIILD